MLLKIEKRVIKHPNDSSFELKLNVESVENYLLKVEELLKCLTLF